MRAQPPVNGNPHSWQSAWAHGVLRLYPRVWRDRYADEVAAVLDDYPVTLWTLFDLLVGALDVRLRSDLLPRRLTPMAQRIRTSEVMIFAAFVLYCLAWLPLHFVADTPSVWLFVVLAHPGIADALVTLNLSGFFAILVITIGGIPLLLVALRQAISRRRWVVALLLVGSVAVALLFLLVTLGRFAAWPLPNPSFGLLMALAQLPTNLRLILGLALILALGVCATATVSVIQRSNLGLALTRFALIPAGLASAAMVVGTVGGLWLLALVNVEAQQLGAPLPLEIIPALLLLAAAALSLIALWRGVRAAICDANTPATAHN